MSNYIFQYPEQYAWDIVSSFKLTPPIDLNKVCETLDVKVNYEELGRMEALLIVSQGKRNIILDKVKARYIRRERFTIAHEIGHYIMPWHATEQYDKKVDFNSDDKIEQEANDFASELLVPKKFLLEDIKDKKVTLELVKKLAYKYDVSLIMMARRIVKYTEEKAVVLLYYESGKKYIQMKSGSFNNKVKDGKITKSSAHKLLTAFNTPAEIKDTLECSIWFENNEEGKVVIEESINQRNYERVFTLLRIVDEVEVIEVEWDF